MVRFYKVYINKIILAYKIIVNLNFKIITKIINLVVLIYWNINVYIYIYIYILNFIFIKDLRKLIS